jgi:hypothetical protein
MSRRPIFVLFATLALAFAACESESSTSDTGFTPDVTADTIDPQTDPGTAQDPGASQDPGTQADPGTTEDPGTQQDPGSVAHPHPHWTGAGWDDFLPLPGETAVYTVTTFGQEEKDLNAFLERDVSFEGGTWDRIVVGSLVPGEDGSAIYLDLSTPWSVRVKGIQVFDTTDLDGPMMTEVFAEPIVIPLDTPQGQTTTIETTISGTYGDFESDMGVVYKAKIVSYDAEHEVPYGTLTGCVHFQAELSGELIGETALIVDVWAHPQQRIIEWVDAPGFILARLKSAWQ